MDLPENNHFIIRGVALTSATFACLLLLSWAIVHWDLDRSIASRFYTPSEGWYLGNLQPWKWLYEYGTIPGLVLAVAALIAWVACLMQTRFHYLHRYFLVIVLTAVIGPGLLVNGILKSYWGRPRPRQVQELGGQWEYRHLYQPGIPGRGESFTCGHCAMGFLFCSLLVFRRKNTWIAFAGGTSGLVLGGLLGAARVVQGAHFPSDVLWSLGIVLMTIISLYYLVLQVPETRRRTPKPTSRPKRYAVTGLLVTAVILMLLAFLMHRPFYKEHDIPLILAPDIKQVVVKSNTNIEKMSVLYLDDQKSRIVLSARGFGWINARYRLHKTLQYENRRITADIDIEKKGFFAELSNELTLYLPKTLENKLTVELVRKVTH
jgi:membrane-associated PAP2 superfamily phosphatase